MYFFDKLRSKLFPFLSQRPQVQSQASSFGLCGRSGAEASLSPNTSISPVSITPPMPHSHVSFIHHRRCTMGNIYKKTRTTHFDKCQTWRNLDEKKCFANFHVKFSLLLTCFKDDRAAEVVQFQTEFFCPSREPKNVSVLQSLVQTLYQLRYPDSYLCACLNKWTTNMYTKCAAAGLICMQSGDRNVAVDFISPVAKI